MLGGKLIYQTSDDYGRIDVIDYMHQIRALQFANDTQQSACLLCNPSFLIHNYAQAMMLPLCWLEPKRILVLGLGAGSIVKFLLSTFENVIIDAVELREAVYNIATQYFSLPEQDERLNVFIHSAQDWINKEHSRQYDLVIVDVFLTSETGEDQTIDIQPLYKQLYQRLTDNGVIAINNLNMGNKINYSKALNLTALFHQPCFLLNVENINSILFASKNAIPHTIKKLKFTQMLEISSFSYQKYFNSLEKLT